MSFEDFREFVGKMAKIANEDLPPFSVTKDMFDFIDIKKDGKIDLDEWLQSFMMFGPNVMQIYNYFKIKI